MKIKVLWLGKTKNKSVKEIIEEYEGRLKKYASFSIQEIKEIKFGKIKPEEIRKKEAEQILELIDIADYVVLLDERGRQMNSMELSQWIQHKMNISISRVVFVIAGAWGAHDLIKERADYKWSLSKLTFTHEMARIILLEQLYRAQTILKGEKYHNQ